MRERGESSKNGEGDKEGEGEKGEAYAGSKDMSVFLKVCAIRS